MADRYGQGGHGKSESPDCGGQQDPDELWGEQDEVEVEFVAVSDEEFRAVVAESEEAEANQES